MAQFYGAKTTPKIITTVAEAANRNATNALKTAENIWLNNVSLTLFDKKLVSPASLHVVRVKFEIFQLARLFIAKSTIQFKLNRATFASRNR